MPTGSVDRAFLFMVGMALFLIFALVVAAIAFFISFWFQLWFLKLFIHNTNARYGFVALTHVGFGIASISHHSSKFLLLLFIGLPILAWMYWKDPQREAF